MPDRNQCQLGLVGDTELLLDVVKVRADGRRGKLQVGRFGLRGLAERVERLNGRFEVRDRAPRGVLVRAEIPLTMTEPA